MLLLKRENKLSHNTISVGRGVDGETKRWTGVLALCTKHHLSFEDIPELRCEQGVYVLIIKVSKPIRQTIGKMGERGFAAGFYSYTGRARKGLSKRLLRHLSSEKRLHWHIDYLLQSSECQVVRIYIFELTQNTECEINQRFVDLSGARVTCPGFGASDCRQGCGAHLIYLGALPGLDSQLKQICSDAIVAYG